jgi:hypothetical protein
MRLSTDSSQRLVLQGDTRSLFWLERQFLAIFEKERKTQALTDGLNAYFIWVASASTLFVWGRRRCMQFTPFTPAWELVSASC